MSTFDALAVLDHMGSGQEQEDDEDYHPESDTMSLDSVSIEESDGEDALHVFLPPIDPDVLGGDKSLEQAQADQEKMLHKMKTDDCYLTLMQSKKLVGQERGQAALQDSEDEGEEEDQDEQVVGTSWLSRFFHM
mmetsp:Transcript_64468/g.94438  ORF Transcript_64468/g.94438 Transcript_64468/m.94438 type:complete len:134 (-) Transcript_64468:227-628(-)